jgi:hypothetical protein
VQGDGINTTKEMKKGEDEKDLLWESCRDFPAKPTLIHVGQSVLRLW